MSNLDQDVAAASPGAAPVENDNGQDNQFVTFSVAGESFAVPMAPVQEIIRVPEVASLPLAPSALDGLANLRGRVLPIVNLRRMFNTDERAHDDSTRALVINIGQPLGFIVDRVASVISVQPGELEPARSIQSVVKADYLTGVINRDGIDGKRQLLMVLDFERLVDEQFGHLQRRAESDATRGLSTDSASRTLAADDQAASDELRLVSFTVAGQEYAIDIADVQEIVQVPTDITSVPKSARHVLGLISLRQRLLPLVSLRTMFNLPAADLDEHHRIVVVAVPGGGQVGLVTDSVKEVLSMPRSQADAMPELLTRNEQLQELSSICRLDGGKRLVSIIATDKLLRLDAIAGALQTAQSAEQRDALTNEEDASMNTHASSTASTSDEDEQVVIFRLGAEEFGVPIMSVQEIVRVPDTLTRVPKTPSFVEGVINLRGTVLPVIDQRSRLELPRIERNDRQRIMVYTLNGVRTGFIVDSVAEVLRIPRSHIEPAPELSDEQHRLIRQVAKLDDDKRLVMLIDPAHLLAAREMQAVEQMAHRESPSSTAAASGEPLARAA